MVRSFAALGAILTFAGCSQPVYRSKTDPLVPVPSLDLERYAGRWYEIARLPNSFEDPACLTVTADYTLRPDKTVEVVNTCVLADDVDRSVGVARRPDPAAPSKLEVSFFRPFYGKYWVIGLDPEYRWALVAEPKGQYLWLLSRTPKLEPAVESEVMGRIEAAGYPLAALIKPANERPPPPR